MKAVAKKCMAAMAVLVLVVAVFAALPAKASEKEANEPAATTANIYGYVASSLGPQVDGITIKLYDIYANNISATVKSLGGGGYLFRNIQPGYYQIRIESQEIGSVVYFGSQTDDMVGWNPRIEAGSVKWTNFTLYEQTKNAHLTGKVTDDSTPANPVPNAEVRLIDTKHNYVKMVKTNSNGTFDMDFYAGTYTIDIRGTGTFDKYSYSGLTTLKGDGEKYVHLSKKPVVANHQNSKVMAQIFVNDKEKTEGLSGDYTINYTSGNVSFWDEGNSMYLLRLNNRDVITAHYHYTVGSTQIVFSDTLTDAWDGKKDSLNFSYGNILNTTCKVFKNGVEWKDMAGNYTIDYDNGVLMLEPTSNIIEGDKITARYETTEREIKKETALVSGKNVKDFKLSKNWIEGYAINETSEFITNPIHVTLYSTNDKRMLESQSEGGANYFKISVPDSMVGNTFILVVHPEGYIAYARSGFKPIFDASGVCSLGQIQFKKADKEQTVHKISFKDTLDWNNISIETTQIWVPSSNFPGIGNENLGNLRLQIDLKFGNGNGILNKTELMAFQNWLETIVPDYVSTNKFITLNDTAYNSSSKDPVKNIISVKDEGGDNVPINSTKNIEIKTLVKAEASGMRFNSPKYLIDLVIRYDTATRNSTYILNLPKYYVRTSDNPEPEKVAMSGYTEITIDPKETKQEETSSLKIIVEKAQNATPVAKILTWNGKDPHENETHAYLEHEKNRTYIVAYNEEITFSAEDSIPVVGDIIGYKWDFGDGTVSDWTENKTIVHKYTKKESQFTVALEVKNSLGNVTKTNSTQQLTVKIDATKPTAVFEPYVNMSHTEDSTQYVLLKKYIKKGDSGIPAGYLPYEKTIITWVNKPVDLNASASYDSMLDAKKKDGTIRYWSYDFGNGNKSGNLTSGLNYTYKGYDKTGMYNITLNVSDVVGMYQTYKISVIVKPKPSSWIWDESKANVTNPVENKKYTFHAQPSIGPFGNTITSYEWSFEFTSDKALSKTASGATVEFTFPKNGAWNVTLNATDIAGNYARSTTKLVIMPGPHPDVAVMGIEFSADPAEEDAEMTITVNVSNLPSGVNANATNVVVKVYDDRNKNWKCDDDELIGTAVVYNGSAYPSGKYPNLKPNQWVLATVKWKPSGSNEHLIIAKVSCDDELDSTLYNNEKNKTVYVNPAKWKTWGIIGGTVVAIVIAVVLIYAWKTGKLSGYRNRRRERLNKEIQKGKEYKSGISKEKTKDDNKDEE